MITVAILTWIAFFIILFELDWKWTYGNHHMWHSILGVIVLVCAALAVSEKEWKLIGMIDRVIFFEATTRLSSSNTKN